MNKFRKSTPFTRALARRIAKVDYPLFDKNDFIAAGSDLVRESILMIKTPKKRSSK